MFSVTFKQKNGEDVTVFAASDENLLNLAQKTNIPINAPCAGNGTCGKCTVEITRQENHPPVFTPVLACQTSVICDMTVIIPETAQSLFNNITTSLYNPETENNTTSYPDKIEKNNFGIAIDLGTTTVSAILADLTTGAPLAKATTGNAQIRYGADVINRILRQQKPDGIQAMQTTAVNDTIIPLIDNLCSSTGITTDKITRLTVAGNTTMNHLMLGIDANPIRIEPYIPPFLNFPEYDPATIGISVAPDAKLIIAPNVGSYVGGDITAGVNAAKTPSGTKITDSPEMTLFIDLGTNGEIVFGNEEFLMTCACSAGPAFEGGDISCGMRATEGAIETFKINRETTQPEIFVIENKKPAGICGSGLIDIIAELFKNKIINNKGKFNKPENNAVNNDRINFDDYGVGSYTIVFAENTSTGKDITINETDIDNFIRAKGAIFAGIISLLAPLGFTPSDIDNVLTAGGIGSSINIKNTISVGMFPDIPEAKYSFIGNSSLDGAYEMLISKEAEEKTNEIAQNMTYIDLSTQPDYMDNFIAACFLPHTDETLFTNF